MVKIEGKRGVYRFRPLLVSRGIVVNQITIMEEYCFRPLLVSRGIVGCIYTYIMDTVVSDPY